MSYTNKTMYDDASHTSLDLQGFLAILRRRLLVLVLVAALVPAAAVFFSAIQEDRYTAKSALLFRDPQLDQKLFGSTFIAQSRDAAREAATNVELVSLDVVAAATARALGRGFTGGQVQDAIEILGEGQADIVSIEATDRDPKIAASIANTFAEQYIAFRRRADRRTIAAATKLVERRLARLSRAEREGATGRVLQRRLEELEILTSLQTGNAERVQVAQPPSSRSSPKPMRNGAIGALLGVLFGLGFALLIDRLDRRLRDPDEVADLFGRPILTIVPATDALIDPERPLPPSAAEAFRMLRANLRYFNVDGDVRSVIVTSPQPGDGKSTVAWNLASAVAAAESRTLLIEADLRRPTLGRWMHETPKVGLSALLSGQGEFEDAVVRVEFGEGDGEGPTHNLDVIFAGSLPPNPDELMESDRMRELVRRAEREYDMVVIDTPPTSVVSDAIPVVREASGVVVVARVDQTTRDAAGKLAQQLRNLEARVLGVVVNHQRARRFGYGYGYGYGYGDDAALGSDGGRAGGKGRAVPKGGGGEGGDESTGIGRTYSH